MCKAARTPVISHDRPSPRLEFCGWTPFPTLSIYDAERRAYHNRRVSDAPIHSVSSTRCGFSFAPHPYPVAASRDPTLFISNVLHKRYHSAVGSRLGATGQATDLFRTHDRSQQAATLLCLFSMNALHACLARKKTEHLRCCRCSVLLYGLRVEASLTSYLRLSHNLSRSDIAFAVEGADDVHTAGEQRYVERVFAAYVGYHCA